MTTDKDSQITIEQLQKTVDEWINTIGVKYFSPLTNMAILRRNRRSRSHNGA